jgi:single-stranded-DNA-specific exonuclease
LPARLDITPFDVGAALQLQESLGVSFPVAQILVRRGFGDTADAAAFLAAADDHPPSAFEHIDTAVELILRHAGDGTRITVHGDYDVDGVCSTAILVRTLRALGADVDWYLPGRSEDGYGLSAGTVQRLAERGTRLLVTVDCAITAVDEVAAARAAGIDVVVTDHHSPRSDGILPAAPIVHPVICGYPCADLCAAGVAHKLAIALLQAAGADPAIALADLDLVALATVADCVPLVGENRRLVRAGLAVLSRTQKPGLRALMRVAKADPGALDATAIGFRLAPRINAAGRMHRADAALELVLTDDEARATEIADELDRLNSERRHVEERIRFSAEAQVATAGEQAAYVLAGDDWHPGVIGIVASRIAERHNRPVVMIAMDGDSGTGSGRSIENFDLLAGLEAAKAHLLRHGGHRAAAGCTLARDQVDAFRAAFVAHAEATLTEEDLITRERADAVVAGDELGLTLAEELERLAPFGTSNPAPSLLVVAARLVDPRPMGEGKHVRFTVRSGGLQARAVAFGRGSLPAAAADGVDATFRLERNEWQGAVEPRLVLSSVMEGPVAAIELAGEPESWEEATLLQLERPVGELECTETEWPSGENIRDRRGGGVAGVIAALVASGEPVLVACADARARRVHLGGRIGGFAVVSWSSLEHDLSPLAGASHLVVLDPPPDPSQLARARTALGDAVTHLSWGMDELRFAEHVHTVSHALRQPLASAYRALRDGRSMPEALGRDATPAWSPVLAGRLLRVLLELGLADFDNATGNATLVAPAGRVELEDSATYRACAKRLAPGERWLSSAGPVAA